MRNNRPLRTRSPIATRTFSIDFLQVFRAVAKALVLPPLGPILIAAIGLLVLRNRPRLGRALAWGGVLLLYGLSTPLVGWLLLQGLDIPKVFDPARARIAQAIVIIGGGVRSDAVEYGGDTLNGLTLERVRYGARVARQTGLPVLVSGGALHGNEAEARLMRAALEDEYGVPVRWAEMNSRNTRENAIESAALLRRDGITHVVLVAHSFDMRRALAEFRDAGIEALPAPTLIPNDRAVHWQDFLPTPQGMTLSYFALYELLANAVRGFGPLSGALPAANAGAAR